MTDLELHDLFAKSGKVDLKTGCWLWTGGHNGAGYGFAWVNDKSIKVSRLSAYLYLGFDLSSSKLICHKCNNKNCFNPEHLYIGTDSDNKHDTVTAGTHGNARKTHCPRGHEYNLENTHTDILGSRHCRVCKKLQMQEFRKKSRNAKQSMVETEKLLGPPIIKDGYTVRYRL
jgi:hypothetical protein